jgi:hypothetical protein
MRRAIGWRAQNLTMASRSVPAIPDAALESHIALLGKTGSGKSNAAVGLACFNHGLPAGGQTRPPKG